MYKNGHNSTCDGYFFMKLVLLDSAYIELSIHAKNSIFMKYPEWSLFSEQLARYTECKECSYWCSYMLSMILIIESPPKLEGR